ncbi:MAG: NADH-quinone oxidoreductase subunit NuoH [Anaerolineae bacterium]|jgi:NADH-quinone oxidoreductase subunit H|nr:NADH-quinone oxidoreductase subunit NuoH [Anaerolineae bacterium]
MNQEFVANLVVQIILIGLIAMALMGGFAAMTVVERKLLGRFTLRYGPNRVGKYGSLQVVADMFKMLFKEEVIPDHVERAVYLMAPGLALVPALLAFAVVPLASEPLTFAVFGLTIVITPWIADINVAVLYILAVGSLGTYGVILGGWSSNNKYSLLGGMRTSAQMLSYELPMGLALLGPILIVGSMRMTEIVEFQASHLGGLLWFILIQPVAFVIFFICGLAEAGRAPFDLPETENELIAGFATEYGGMKFGLFFGAEYVHMIVLSFITATVFLGGWIGPFSQQIPLLGLVYLLVKVALVLFLMIWIRASTPRIRFDKLMKFCWKFLLPLSIANAAVTALVLAIIFF